MTQCSHNLINLPLTSPEMSNYFFWSQNPIENSKFFFNIVCRVIKNRKYLGKNLGISSLCDYSRVHRHKTECAIHPPAHFMRLKRRTKPAFRNPFRKSRLVERAVLVPRQVSVPIHLLHLFPFFRWLPDAN